MQHEEMERKFTENGQRQETQTILSNIEVFSSPLLHLNLWILTWS